MPIQEIIDQLRQLGDDPKTHAALARRDARVAWVRETMLKIRAANQAVDDAWDKRLEEMEEEGINPDQAEDPPELLEEAALRELMAEVEAVRDHDRWPRALYWGGV